MRRVTLTSLRNCKQNSRALWMARKQTQLSTGYYFVLDILTFLPGMHLKPTHPSCVKLNLFILYHFVFFFFGKKIIDFSVTKSKRNFQFSSLHPLNHKHVCSVSKMCLPLFIHFLKTIVLI